MCGVPPLILKNLNSAVVSLAQLVPPSVALPAQLVQKLLATKEYFLSHHKNVPHWAKYQDLELYCFAPKHILYY